MNLCLKLCIFLVIFPLGSPANSSNRENYARTVSTPLLYASVAGNALISSQNSLTLATKSKDVIVVKKKENPRKTQILKKEPYACNCQKWAQNYLGKKFGYIKAADIPVNQKEPEVGVAILTWENSVGTTSGHVGVVIDIDFDNKIQTIKEANYVSCQVTTRKLAFNDRRIRGYHKL